MIQLFFIINVRSTILCMSIFSLVVDCLILKTSKKKLGVILTLLGHPCKFFYRLVRVKNYTNDLWDINFKFKENIYFILKINKNNKLFFEKTVIHNFFWIWSRFCRSLVKFKFYKIFYGLRLKINYLSKNPKNFLLHNR